MRTYVRIGSAILMAWAIVATNCLADKKTEPITPLNFDLSALDDSVFQSRSQHRLLAAAQESITNHNYTAAFDILLELFRPPYDSSHIVSDSNSVMGTRSAALQTLSSLPLSERRRWNQFCQGHGNIELTKALQSESRSALSRVATKFPSSSVAADALITEIILALNTQEIGAAQLAMKQLRELLPLSILNGSRTTFIHRLNAAVERESNSYRIATKQLPANIRRSLHSKPVWYWNDNAWNHPQGPDSLPKRRTGSQFNHRTGWQHPVLNGDTVVLRTPAGIACLDRCSGEQQWFLPFASVVVPRRTEDSTTDSIFEITVEPLQRLEVTDEFIYFVDGQRSAPIPSPHGIRSPLVLEPGATNIVAVRTGPFPVVLWQLTTEPSQLTISKRQTAQPTENFQYAFENVHGRLQSADLQPETDVSVSADSRLAGHLFLSAPRAFAERLYVTTRYDGTTWLNCLSAAHGTLNWQQPLTWLGAGSDDDQQTSAVVGGITNDNVICLFGNGLIAACSPIDGRIEWIQSILFEEDSNTEMQDSWRAPHPDNRIVPQAAAGSEFGGLWMILSPAGIICTRRGSRGISCLDTRTGQIQWSTSRGVQTGTAAGQQDLTCIGLIDSRLITAGYGHCRAINVADGSQSWVRPLGNHDGRICSDEWAVYVALNSGRLLTIDGTDGSVIRTQEVSISQNGPGFVSDLTGIVETSAWSARAWEWHHEPVDLTQLSVEKALDCLATHRLSDLRLLTPNPDWSAVHSVDASAAVVSSSVLSHDQSLKYSLLMPDVPGNDTILSDRLSKTPDQLIELIPGWKMPLKTAVRTLKTGTKDTDTGASMDDLILRPEQLGPLDAQFATAENLIQDSQLNRAELLLLNMKVVSSSPDAVQRDKLLNTVRDSALAPGMRHTTPVTAVKSEVHVESSNTIGFRLGDIAESYQKFRLRAPAATVPPWTQSLFITFVPSQLRSNVGVSPHVGFIDLGRGIETAWESLSRVRFPATVSYQGNWNSPGLVIVAPKRRIGVISLLDDAPLTPLWTRPHDNDAKGLVIAITSRQLIVSTNHGVQSLHPLTGKLLWSHDWKQSHELHHLEGQFLGVYCSDKHIILLSSLGTGYVVLRAADGAVVREGSRRTGQLSRVIDEYLLTKTAAGYLEITHLVTGSQVPVDLNDQRIADFHSGEEFGRGRALVVTADSEFIILDPASGKIETRIDVSDHLSAVEHTLTAPRVVRRAGLIYAALSVRNWRSPYVPDTVFGEAIAGQGVLICIDPSTGDELWRQSRNSLVIPPVFGDPCPFLVIWSTNYTNARRQFIFRDGRRHTSLDIKVLDAFTGKIVARKQQRYAARPLQVLHDSTQRELTITTDQSIIRVNYSE
ncbi:MAG: PQQ-like beta-propeller repeat protein [Fuerstiella sp.]|nr:PQQ-like beta-propeller repeat protein [Fuerstiella sp.]